MHQIPFEFSLNLPENECFMRYTNLLLGTVHEDCIRILVSLLYISIIIKQFKVFYKKRRLENLNIKRKKKKIWFIAIYIDLYISKSKIFLSHDMTMSEHFWNRELSFFSKIRIYIFFKIRELISDQLIQIHESKLHERLINYFHI